MPDQPAWIELSRPWRAILASWPDEWRERHRAEAERLMDLDKPWSRDAAEWLAFERLEDAVRESMRLAITMEVT